MQKLHALEDAIRAFEDWQSRAHQDAAAKADCCRAKLRALPGGATTTAKQPKPQQPVKRGQWGPSQHTVR